MNKYSLKAIIKDPVETKTKTSFKVLFFELYLNGKLIKRTNNTETKRIMNNLKPNNIKLKKEYDYTITDQKFINNFVSKPINRKGLTGVGAISAVGLVLLTGIYSSKPKEEEFEQTILPLKQSNEIKASVSETEELVYEEEIEQNPIDVEPITSTEPITEETPILEESNDVNYYDMGNDNIVSFSAEDKSDDFYEAITSTYGDSINKYASMYGIDPNLIVAIISQENPTYEKNNSSSGAYGLMQVEDVWNNKELTCYNKEQQCYETIIVDTSKANSDADYSIKVGCMIFASTAEAINKRTNLTDAEAFQATLIAYNKGITVTTKVLNNTYSFDEFIDAITSTKGGDNNYTENVLSHLPDETVLYMQCKGKDYYVGINNEYVKGYTI